MSGALPLSLPVSSAGCYAIGGVTYWHAGGMNYGTVVWVQVVLAQGWLVLYGYLVFVRIELLSQVLYGFLVLVKVFCALLALA
jgi:hypothetical protein